MPVVRSIDAQIISYIKDISIPMARLALLVVFSYFGLLKVLDLSPATPLVLALHQQTIPWFPFETFSIVFGLYEIAIGLCFVIPRMERAATALLVPHVIATSLPLFLLPQHAWSKPFVPTLEGQYIIKNLALLATALAIASHLTPFSKKSSH